MRSRDEREKARVQANDTWQYRLKGAYPMTARVGNGRTLSAVKRARIIHAGKIVFLQNGFGAASMDVIAANAGVSKMTVYRHFRSKELLFAGVIDALCQQIIDDDLERMLMRPPKEALRKFATKIAATLFARETIELHRIVIAESRRFPKLGRLFYQSGPAACIEMLELYLMRHRGDGLAKHGSPRALAEEFLDLIRGYPHLRMLLGIDKRPSKSELRRRVDSAVRHLLG
jgi:TetR/AcrR family transcriptional regulator, mexJK operon transcriptional repressor